MEALLKELEREIGPNNLERGLSELREGRNPIDFLVMEQVIAPRTILLKLTRIYELPVVDLDNYEPSRDAIKLVSEEVARRFCILPLFRIKDQLFVAVSDPDDEAPLEYLYHLTRLSVEKVLAVRPSIQSALAREYEGRMEQEAQERAPVEAADDSESPVIRLVNQILTRGIQMGASDIHLEPYEKSIAVRYRIDGILHEFPMVTPDLFSQVVSRMKVISGLDVAERRRPQDGRAKIKVGDKEYDMRVSILPSLIGEGIVFRILDTSGALKQLEELGFSPSMMTRYEKLIRRPHGIVLVTGPTGSGKSTTLYATLNRIKSPDLKIITVEDPVEYLHTGIHQVQVNEDIDYTFAEALRSILRHDPDIIMLGEMRDRESSEIAIRASLTGHLVFSTLHTNDAPSTVTRLVDMGIQPYLVFSSLTAVLAQRLIRRLCPQCKRPAKVDEAHRLLLGIESVPRDATIFEPVGCAQCNNLGYKGRIAVYELLEITPEIKSLSKEGLTSEEITRVASQQGFVTLRESAIENLFRGLTGTEEILRLTVE